MKRPRTLTELLNWWRLFETTDDADPHVRLRFYRRRDGVMVVTSIEANS